MCPWYSVRFSLDGEFLRDCIVSSRFLVEVGTRSNLVINSFFGSEMLSYYLSTDVKELFLSPRYHF